LRFMLEWAGPNPHYRPVGVWVEDGASFVVAFTETGEIGEHARGVMAAMKAADVIPPDFLEHHIDGLPVSQGDRGPIFETDRYKTVSECAAAIASFIRASFDDKARRWTRDIEEVA
jgi:hypothetical protein